MNYFRITLTAITLLVLSISQTGIFAYSYETQTERRQAKREEVRKTREVQRTEERKIQREEARKSRVVEQERFQEEKVEKETPREEKQIIDRKSDTQSITNTPKNIKNHDTKNNTIQTQRKNYTQLRKIAKEKRVSEREAFKKERMETRKNQIQTLRNNFESKKKEILDKVDSWEITRKEATELVLKEREKSISSTRNKIKEEQRIEKQEQRGRVETIIHEQINNKLSELEVLSNEKQREIYDKIISILDSKLSSSSISENNQVLLWIIREVIIEKKNSLN